MLAVGVCFGQLGAQLDGRAARQLDGAAQGQQFFRPA